MLNESWIKNLSFPKIKVKDFDNVIKLRIKERKINPP